MTQKTITINGVAYDSQSGLPVGAAPTTATAAPVSFGARKPVHMSQSVHQATEKSRTLNRHTVKKSAPVITVPAPATGRSQSITKFAPHPAGIKSSAPSKMMDIAPAAKPATTQARAPKNMSRVIHAAPVAPAAPHAQPAKAVAAAPQPASAATASHAAPAAAPKPSQIIKQEAIAEALATPTKKDTKRRSKATKKTNKNPRFLSIASASLALLLLGGYFTYLNMPSLSVRVAAAQAGVDATYPGYQPDGYSINGPVAYSQGAVSMKFAANGSPQSFTIDQSKKSWDSSAVLENYVKPKVGGSYIPYNERGLTIYTFNNSAAWVNNGVFYTITGDAPLSSDQMLHIATSM